MKNVADCLLDQVNQILDKKNDLHNELSDEERDVLLQVVLDMEATLAKIGHPVTFSPFTGHVSFEEA